MSTVANREGRGCKNEYLLLQKKVGNREGRILTVERGATGRLDQQVKCLLTANQRTLDSYYCCQNHNNRLFSFIIWLVLYWSCCRTNEARESSTNQNNCTDSFKKDLGNIFFRFLFCDAIVN